MAPIKAISNTGRIDAGIARRHRIKKQLIIAAVSIVIVGFIILGILLIERETRERRKKSMAFLKKLFLGSSYGSEKPVAGKIQLVAELEPEKFDYLKDLKNCEFHPD